MNFKFVLVFTLFVVFAVHYSECAPQWGGWKELEDAGKRVFKALQRGLPVVQGYAEALKTFKDQSK